ncbi:hypothetical protein TNCV_1157971 [Trichonephila clavipes]|nr:hypothetical protein TNCV_1157971 [Trichonephila clavipes]
MNSNPSATEEPPHRGADTRYICRGSSPPVNECGSWECGSPSLDRGQRVTKNIELLPPSVQSHSIATLLPLIYNDLVKYVTGVSQALSPL